MAIKKPSKITKADLKPKPLTPRAALLQKFHERIEALDARLNNQASSAFDGRVRFDAMMSRIEALEMSVPRDDKTTLQASINSKCIARIQQLEDRVRSLQEQASALSGMPSRLSYLKGFTESLCTRLDKLEAQEHVDILVGQWDRDDTRGFPQAPKPAPTQLKLKRTGWVNIYAPGDMCSGAIYSTEHDAKLHGGVGVLATTKIEWEE